jgi:hypothetical protein
VRWRRRWELHYLLLLLLLLGLWVQVLHFDRLQW